MSGQESRTIGAWGEEMAANWIRKQGGKVIAANFRCRFGEIDLICEEKGYLCFTEVKLRKGTGYGRAGEFVDFRKQNKLHTTAQFYLLKHPTALQPRFDVIEIYAPYGMETKAPEITRIENAF